MPRAKKAWSVLRGEIRQLLGEATAASSQWPDALLLVLWNHCLDHRLGMMADVQEDWLTSTIDLSLVANQAAYALPVGSNSVKRVLRVITQGGETRKLPIARFEPWNDVEVSSGDGNTTLSYRPTYRLRGGSLILNPAPAFSEANGIQVETEPFTDPFTGDASVLPDAFPDILETLLEWDTACAAIRVEGSLGEDTEGGFMNHLLGMRAEVEVQFLRFIEKRQQTPWRTRAFSYGA